MPGHHREDRPADQHVVEVRHDEVGVVRLEIEWRQRHHHAGEPAHDEVASPPKNEQHRHRAHHAPRQQRRDEAEDLHARRNRHGLDAAEKNASEMPGSPVVNMWCTQSPKLRKPVPTAASTIQL
jgi:hypothetical protein